MPTGQMKKLASYMSPTGKKYILTVVDYATRYLEAIPLANIQAETVADAMLWIFTNVGFPRKVISDQGTQFTAEITRQWDQTPAQCSISPRLMGFLVFCRLRTHQWCFIIFNILLFHALLFGADFMEEYFLRSGPISYSEAKFMEIRELAKTLDMYPMKDNISKSFVINEPSLCSDKNVFLLSIIFSCPENKTGRDRIRSTWGNVTSVKHLGIINIFALGRPVSGTIQSDVLNESHVYKDIIEGNYLDTIQNKTHKTLMMIEWTLTFCPNTKFLLKTDEEMFVNIKSLTEYLLDLEAHSEDIYTGRVIHQSLPDRNHQSPNFVPIWSYSETNYPDYCSGSAMVISLDVAKKVYIASKDISTLVPSDVFIGICTQRAGIIPIHSSRFSGPRHITYNRCCYKFIFTSLSVDNEQISFVWRDMNNGEECSILETYYGLLSCKVWTYLDKFKYFNMEKIKNGAWSV
ncbi:beta-1,3-galactosyltransferase 9 [Bombina bombina]|uniref:beta-1,3-galactosyltransferase 9 n=1 Tax=Bombina bombina TaxID=8345 RepID=UPI00235A4881|nr:beta-1,3-galactosyltransferase 9 [Bombina bombina]